MKNKIDFQYLIFGTVSIIVGLFIYLIYRPETYISKLILSYIEFQFYKYKIPVLNNNFIKFYFPDYLWAFSLSCGLHLIFKPKQLNTAYCTILVSIIGLMYELLQWVNFINGTGDFIDIIFYTLAGFTVNIINFKKEIGKNEDG